MAKIYTPTDLHLSLAQQYLKNNQAIAVPTETVYGLAANACSDQAISEIYRIKKRPNFNPLIIHIKSPSEAEKYAYLTEKAKKLMAQFWPGPLTLILQQNSTSKLSTKATAGLQTIALRCPKHPVMQKLLASLPFPLAAPSANLSGTISPTTPHHVHESLGAHVSMILAGGKAEIGLESTILDLSSEDLRILRPGSLCQEEIEDIIGPIHTKKEASSTIRAPGMLKSHYAPSLPLRLNAEFPEENEAFIAFGPLLKKHGDYCLNLSEEGNLEEAAANLFDMMHRLDNSKYKAIAVMTIPNKGIGIAMNDRLKRAAADKDQ